MMNKKLLKKLRFVIVICIIILVIEFGYIIYCSFFKEEKSLYFDGINAVSIVDNGYVSVGSNNNNDMFYEKAKITKYDDKKNKVFERLYNKGYNGVFYEVIEDKGSFVAVGSYESTQEQHDELVRSALIVKYDKEGNIEFENELKVLDNSKFTSVVAVDDGYIVTGQSIYKNTKVGESSLGGALLIKYDKNGKEIFRKNYGNNKTAVYNDLIIFDNNIYAVGKNENKIGMISKYDMEGNMLAYNDYKHTDSLGFTGIVEAGNNLYAVGANMVSNGDTDALIVKYDLNCTYLTQVVHPLRDIERFNKVTKDDHDNIIAIGTRAILDKKNKNRVFNYDGLIAKYDSELEEIDLVTYGDDRDDYFTDVKMDNGNYLVVGYTLYDNESYLSKFIKYSDALKVLEID